MTDLDAVEELAAALDARVRAFGSGDTAAVLDPAVAADAVRLRMLATDSDGRMAAPAVRTLAWLHWCRYQALPDGEDTVDGSIAFGLFGVLLRHEPMVVARPVRRYLIDRADPPEQAEIATTMLAHHQDADDPDGLDETIDVLDRAVVALPDDHPGRSPYLSNLGHALVLRYERRGDPADVDRSVVVAEQAADLRPGAASPLVNLGNALRLRYEDAGDPADLDRALESTRRAATAVAPDAPTRTTINGNLAIMLLARFGRSKDGADLDEAARYATQAARNGRAMHLANLGVILLARFRHRKDVADLTRAVETLADAATRTPPGHPDRLRRLAQLSDARQARARHSEDRADLDEAIETAVETLRLADNAGVTDHELEGNLSDLLQMRYERAGNRTDLDGAIDFARRGVDGTAGRAVHAGHLSGLGNALAIRHQLTGSTADIERAVDAHRQAARETAGDDPDLAGVLMNLSNSLRLRYEHAGDPADLDEAVDAGRRGLAYGDHASVLGQRSNLAAALVFRHYARGSVTDLDEAVEHLRLALADAPPDYPFRFLYRSNLALALRTRHVRTRDPADLDEAVEHLREVVKAVAATRHERSTFLANLATTLRVRHDVTGEPTDLEEAVRFWQAAVETSSGPVAERIRAANDAARSVAATRGPADAKPHYLAAVALLPLLVWRGNTVTDQRRLLQRHASQLALDAAAAAVADGQPATAVQAAENGRAVLWAQLLDMRGDLTALERVDPTLAARLVACRAALDRPEPAAAPFTRGD